MSLRANSRGSSMTASRGKRALWALLVLLHAPAFLGTWTSLVTSGLDVGLFAQCIGLSASMLLFALKFLDVPFLRWRTDWRSCVAIGLVVATAHLGLFESASGEMLWLEHSPLFSVAFLMGRPSDTIDRLLAVWARLRASLDDTSPFVCQRGTARRDADYVPCWVSPRQPCIPRSPPA